MLDALDESSDLDQESPTLDLTNDCFRFVTGSFEVISLSAPHIYHSALLLSPKTSIVQKLYGPQAKPLARVVQGLPDSWDPSIATTQFPGFIYTVAWSPCSRFIAVAQGLFSGIVILDAVTLKQLHTMQSQDLDIYYWSKLVYSPDGHLLTGYSYQKGLIVSWDLQTGGLISEISTGNSLRYRSMPYSRCGTMLGGLSESNAIIIYNILSGIQMTSHSVPEFVHDTIWTHGERLRFISAELGSITIWEVSFTSTNAPAQISSLPTPENLPLRNFVLLPTLHHLAFILKGRVLVWDAQCQKILLDSIDVKNPKNLSFSLNGHFLICETHSLEFHLWKKTPDSYIPHQIFAFGFKRVAAVISPNGQSIVLSSLTTLQLWHITNSSTSFTSFASSTSSTSSATPATPVSSASSTSSAFSSDFAPKDLKDFLLEFFPDEPLIAVAQRLGNTITILNVKSGNKQLVIDAGIDTKICGIGIIGSKIIAIGDGKVMTWELPVGDCVSNTQRNISKTLLTTALEHPEPIEDFHASISPDLSYVAFVNMRNRNLWIYNIHHGRELVAAGSQGWIPGFTPDGNKVWCAEPDGTVDKWAIFKDDESETIKLEQLWKSEKPLSGFPWHSSCGYQVTDDGWVLSSRGKPLLGLPYHWQPEYKFLLKWSGNLLAVWNFHSPAPVILELEV